MTILRRTSVNLPLGVAKVFIRPRRSNCDPVIRLHCLKGVAYSGVLRGRYPTGAWAPEVTKVMMDTTFGGIYAGEWGHKVHAWNKLQDTH